MILDMIQTVILWVCVFAMLDRFGYNRTDRIVIMLTLGPILSYLGWL